MDSEAEKAFKAFEHSFKDKDLKTVTPPSFIKGGKFDPVTKNIVDQTEKGSLYIPQSNSHNLKRDDKVWGGQSGSRGALSLAQSEKKKIDTKIKLDDFYTRLKRQNDDRQRMQDRLREKGVIKKNTPNDGAQEKKEESIYYIFERMQKIIPHSFCEIDAKTLTVYGLTPEQDDSMIKQAFELFGEIISVGRKCIYIPDEIDAMAKIVGYVEYLDYESAKEALQNQQQLKVILGEDLRVRLGAPVYVTQKVSEILFQENGQIKVEFPDNSILRLSIDRISQFVASDGYSAEKSIMELERTNNHFAFLFIQDSVEHIYYKWRVYSLLMGDNMNVWRTQPFKMSMKGPLWIPPILESKRDDGDSNPKIDEKFIKQQGGTKPLGDQERYTFDNYLRELTTQRRCISFAMVFCMDQADCCVDIVLIISQSIQQSVGNMPVALARLYLISDILRNSTMGSKNLWSFRKYLEWQLPEIFENLNKTFNNPKQCPQLTQQTFKEKVIKVLKVWNDWAIYDQNYMTGIESIFLCEPNKFSEDNQRFLYDASTTTGVKLTLIEDELQIINFDDLERKAHENGVCALGTKNELIARLLMVEEYKLQRNQNLSSKSLEYQSKKEVNTEVFEMPKVYRWIDKFNRILLRNQTEVHRDELDEYIQDGLKLLKFMRQRFTELEKAGEGKDFDDVDNRFYEISKSGVSDSGSIKIITSETKAEQQMQKLENEQVENQQQNQHFIPKREKSQDIQMIDNFEGEPLSKSEIDGIQKGDIRVLCYKELQWLYQDIQRNIKLLLKDESDRKNQEKKKDQQKQKKQEIHQKGKKNKNQKQTSSSDSSSSESRSKSSGSSSSSSSSESRNKKKKSSKIKKNTKKSYSSSDSRHEKKSKRERSQLKPKSKKKNK